MTPTMSMWYSTAELIVLTETIVLVRRSPTMDLRLASRDVERERPWPEIKRRDTVHRMNMGLAAEAWLKTVPSDEQDRSRRLIDGARARIDSWLNTTDELNVEDLNREDITEAFAWRGTRQQARIDKTIDLREVNRQMNTLREFLNWCRSQGYIDSNPAVGVEVRVDSRLDVDGLFEDFMEVLFRLSWRRGRL